MKRLTRLYISLIFTVTLVLASLTLPMSAPSVNNWKAFFMLLALSMAAQVVGSAMPGHYLRIPHIIFFFTGVLLLPPLLFSMLIVATVLVNWEHNRREGNPIVRDKHLLPLRIGTHLLAAFGAYWTLEFTLTAPIWVLGLGQLLSILVAALSYALLHQAAGRGINLARGLEVHESGIIDVDSLLIRLAMLLAGYGVAILWLANPWLLLVGLIPGLYYYQVHVIPSLKTEAYTDAKTGLSNMRHFDELFSTELTRSSQGNQPLSMIMVDIDDLGKINNSYGHLTGDSALQTVSGTIRHQINMNDIAARLGGEEFAVVLPETSHEDAIEFANLLRSQIELAKFDAVNQEGELRTTASIGVASFPRHGLTTLEIIHAADVAMYQAKMLGKNRVVSAEDVQDSLKSEWIHQESTEVLNYRAAFSSTAGAAATGPAVELTPHHGIHARSSTKSMVNSATDSIQVSTESIQNRVSSTEVTVSQFHRGTISGASSAAGAAGAAGAVGTTEHSKNATATHRISDHGSAAQQARLTGQQPEPNHTSAPQGFTSGYQAVDHQAVDHQAADHIATDHLEHELGEKIKVAMPSAEPNGHRSGMALGGLFASGRFSGVSVRSNSARAHDSQHETTTELINAIVAARESEKQTTRLSQIPFIPVLLTVCCGFAAMAAGLVAGSTEINLLALLVFGVVALIVQMLQYAMYESSTISVSAAIILAATLVEGMPGLLTTCTAVVLVHSIQYQPALHKVAFNWSTHIIAGMAPFLVYQFGITDGLASMNNLPLMVLLTLMSAVAYYAIESAFIAYAVGRATDSSIVGIWNTQFRWLAIHYIVAGFVALSMALAYIALGPWGVVAFAMPVLLIYFAQKQYVLRTEQSTKELNWMNSRLRKANGDITRANQAFHRLTDELFMILSKIIDARDPDVHGHASQVSNYAQAIGQELGLKQDEIEQLRRGALLHDIGKLGIPESILHKPGPLTDQEYETMKSHPGLGADLLSTCHDLRELAPYVRHHHEWWNGNGYPSSLYQEQIPLGARIIAVCDAVEAMASDRPYRRGLSHEEIITELKAGKGIQFDPVVVDTFTQILKQEGLGMLKNTAKGAA